MCVNYNTSHSCTHNTHTHFFSLTKASRDSCPPTAAHVLFALGQRCERHPGQGHPCLPQPRSETYQAARPSTRGKCSCVAHQAPPVRSLDSPDAHAPVVSATACSQMRDSERKTMDRIERELEAAKVLILMCWRKGCAAVRHPQPPNFSPTQHTHQSNPKLMQCAGRAFVVFDEEDDATTCRRVYRAASVVQAPLHCPAVRLIRFLYRT